LTKGSTLYITAIGAENFFIDGMTIQSKHYCGVDLSSVQDADKFAAGQIERITKKHELYQEILTKPTFNNADLCNIFYSLIEKQFFDDEFVTIIDSNKIEVTDEEYWNLVLLNWRRQEFNSSGNRKKNWIKIFSHRKPIESLTAEVPDKFTAFRAGKPDGFSWTLDKSTAEWFHNRFKSQFGNIPFLTQSFTKEDVVFYTNARGEQEVVIIPK